MIIRTVALISLVMVALLGVNASPVMVYYIQPGTPVAIQNFIKPDKGCNWSGIGGQVFDSMGNPITGLIVSVRGQLEGHEIQYYVVTGSSMQLGPGGFDVTLADHPVATQGTISIQLFDIVGTPLTPPIPFQTYNQCEKSLLLVNIVELPETIRFYFPIVRR